MDFENGSPSGTARSTARARESGSLLRGHSIGVNPLLRAAATSTCANRKIRKSTSGFHLVKQATEPCQYLALLRWKWTTEATVERRACRAKGMHVCAAAQHANSCYGWTITCSHVTKAHVCIWAPEYMCGGLSEVTLAG